jgi:hypothetical protein
MMLTSPTTTESGATSHRAAAVPHLTTVTTTQSKRRTLAFVTPRLPTTTCWHLHSTVALLTRCHGSNGIQMKAWHGKLHDSCDRNCTLGRSRAKAVVAERRQGRRSQAS